MCLAVPGKVISIEDSNPDLKMARVDFSGVVREICIQWVPGVREGDYVLAHVGMALNVVDEEEAAETLQLLREMGELDARPGNDTLG
jgi:hydrogenase expression/formation protein HypC